MVQFRGNIQAKAKIKNLLNEEKRTAALDGKEILERKFKSQKVEFSQENLQILANRYKAQSILDLYYDIAKGRIEKDKLDLNAITNPQIREVVLKEQHKSKEFKSGPKKEIDSKTVILEDEPDFEYAFACCCNPIPGDDIFGFITIGEGVKIHRTNCPNAIRLNSNYGYRILKARWAIDGERSDEAFLVGIRITGIDSVGVISNITEIISKELKVNMKAITVDSNKGTFEGNISLYIYDTAHLEALMAKLRSSNPLMTVSRVDVSKEHQVN